MSHSLVKIWVHGIWSTKERNPIISSSKEALLHIEMYNQFKESGCPVKIINGMPDHVHSLFLLNPQKSVSDVIKQVKGASSHWANDTNFIPGKFVWQTGFAAYSVSESQLDKVYAYIRDQKAHHAKKTFAEEYDELLRLHGLIK
jgi:REP element-mobilizing transposase RayT